MQSEYVTIEKLAELTGLSKNAIEQYKKKGKIREKVHFIYAANGRIMIKLKRFYEWLEGKQD